MPVLRIEDAAILNDKAFWENEVGCRKPRIIGLGKSKLIKIVVKRATV
jgi:hypothetical protein